MKGKGEINNFPTEAAGLQETVGGKIGANFSASSCVELKVLDGQAPSVRSERLCRGKIGAFLDCFPGLKD